MRAVTALELGLLAAAAVPAGRLAVDRALWRLFPRVPAAAIGALLAGAVAVVAAATAAPGALHPAAAVAAAVLVATTIRARPSFGRSRGLPPGSLSLVSSIRALADRRHLLDAARRHGPVFKLQQVHRSAVCVVGLERGHRLLREHEDSLAPLPLPFSHEVAGGFLRYMDDGVHAAYAPVFRRALGASVMRAGEPGARDAARRELDRMACDVAGGGGRGVAPLPYLQRFVEDAFVRALFGAAPGEPVHGAFGAAYEPLRRHDISRPLADEGRAALASLRALLGEHAQRLRRARTPVCALTAMSGLRDDLPDATCVDNLVFIHRVATDNVWSLLHWLVALVGAHPDWAAALRREVLAGGSDEKPDLVDRTVMETLRLAQSEFLYRRVADDIAFEGYLLPRGWLLRVCVWESHRDPAVFADPERFDPHRFRARRLGASVYSPFGHGRHACNGVPLSNLVCRVLLEELSRFDWSVDWDGKAERGLRHWRHWQPSSNLELRLTRARA